MRVLMLSWEYPPHNVGGLGKHVTELVPALAAEGVEIHLLTPRWVSGMGEEVVDEVDVAPSEPDSPVTVHRVDLPQVDRADFFAGAWRTNLTLEERGRALVDAAGLPHYDLIHAHDWLVAFAGVALKHAFKRPLVATVHATEYGRNRGHVASELSRAIHNVEWWLAYEAWRVVCCSHFMADEVTAAFNAPGDKIDIIPNGVETARFDALDGVDLSAFRRRHAAPVEPIIFYIGRLVYEKGVHVLVDAMPRVLGRHPGARLLIAGTGSFAPWLRERADALGLGDHVRVLGFVDDDERDRLLRVADAAVFPSLYEPFGIVALEAMAARAAVVVADVGGLAEVVALHETGIRVHPGDADSLAWGILHTLDHPDWTRARVENAYGAVRASYNWRAIARQTREVYERVLRERAGADW